MKLKTAISILALLFVCTSVHAEPIPIPAAPKFGASSYILMDFASGSVLVDHNSKEHVEPASITKIMTAYVVYHALKRGDVGLDDQVLVSEKAWRSIGSRTFVEVGSRVSLEDLLLGMVVQSGNDASIALAEHVAGTEDSFTSIMNAHAKQLGLEDTSFINATGLPAPGHYTTAYDIALLSRAMIKEFPQEYQRYAQKEFTYNDIKQYNRNRLLWRDDTVDGIKTGFTQAARYCLAASAARRDMRLISVVMGADSPRSRMVNSQALLNYGFRHYESHKLYQAGQVLSEQRIWQGESKLTPLGLDQDLFVAIPRGQFGDLKAVSQIPQDVVAPIAKGDRLGTVKISFRGEAIAERPLIALDANPRGNFWRRVVDFFARS